MTACGWRRHAGDKRTHQYRMPLRYRKSYKTRRRISVCGRHARRSMALRGGAAATPRVPGEQHLFHVACISSLRRWLRAVRGALPAQQHRASRGARATRGGGRWRRARRRQRRGGMAAWRVTAAAAARVGVAGEQRCLPATIPPPYLASRSRQHGARTCYGAPRGALWRSRWRHAMRVNRHAHR